MTSSVSVCAIDTGIPLRKPRVTKRRSRYGRRSSSNVNVGPSKTFSASTKSMPWSLRFLSRLALSHSNRIYEVYIHLRPAATRTLAAR